MEAFRRFHAKHPDSVWALHTLPKGGLDLERMRDRLGLTKAIRFSDQYLIMAGLLSQEDLAGWYNGLDVYLGTSMGEGFGIPHAEAQACGVPVIATRGSAMTEVCAKGWLVDGQGTWAEGHRSPWVRPSIPGIVKALEAAWSRGRAYEVKRAAARQAVRQYDIPLVVKAHLVPALKSLRMEL
jgi:glycosyltransferase involved in cell wall biosynthesis